MRLAFQTLVFSLLRFLQLSMLSIWKFHFGSCSCRKTPKFGLTNCLTNNFLHCEFQLSMLSSLKVSFGEVRPPPPGGSPNLLQIIASQTTSYIVSFNFLYWAVQKLHYGRVRPFGRPPNLVQTIVSQKTSYIVSFNFLCWAVQKFHFFFWGGGSPLPPRIPKFGQNNCLAYKFLHCEFQLSTSSRTKWPLLEPKIWEGALWRVASKTICKQSHIGLPFHQISDFYIDGWVQCFSVQVIMNKCFLNPEKSFVQIHLVIFVKNALRFRKKWRHRAES